MATEKTSLRTILAIAACKATRGILRTLHKGGTALPGKAAMLFQKDILSITSKGMEIIVVTGTNGKTTTSRMLEHALTASGEECLANKSGANLLSGVTAEITANATFLGKPKTHYAVIECDEGALKQVVPLIHPKVIVVTNLFRDQLDRYGEVMHTLDTIRVGILKVPETILCLNADCSLTSSLAGDVPNPVVFYGLNEPTGDQSEREISDARHCIRCGTVYEYDYHTYAHLGGFRCPKCGYQRQDPDVAITKIIKMDESGSELAVDFKKSGESAKVRVGLPAVYNMYNAIAAIAAYTAFGKPSEEIIGSLSDVHSCFGRMETFKPGEQTVQMILVKNPAGCNQSLEFLRSLDKDYTAVFCLNDRTADGHDISWIWDANHELVATDSHAKAIYVVGDRADDMALRLKYAGAPEEKIIKASSNEELLEMMKESERPVFVLPNYTSMLSLRKVLGEACGKQDFWKG